MKLLCNLLSLARIPLAMLLLIPHPAVRVSAILGAVLTDFFDGYLARRANAASRFGAILDPITDKFFAVSALSIFLFEGGLSNLEALAFLSRDLFLLAFALYLTLSNNWGKHKIRSLTWGKVSTTCQLFFLLGLALDLKIPSLSYSIFVVFGALAFRDFYLHLRSIDLET